MIWNCGRNVDVTDYWNSALPENWENRYTRSTRLLFCFHSQSSDSKFQVLWYHKHLKICKILHIWTNHLAWVQVHMQKRSRVILVS